MSGQFAVRCVFAFSVAFVDRTLHFQDPFKQLCAYASRLKAWDCFWIAFADVKL
jgi:hypothetical protein